jgi:hypothetical protein
LDLTFGPHFWTSLQPRAAAGACCLQGQVASGWWFRVWCTIEGRSPRRYFEKKSTSKKPELTNLQPKPLRNWTSLSAAVHFFGPHSLSPFGPHWSPTREHLYKSRCACPNWTSLFRWLSHHRARSTLRALFRLVVPPVLASE